MVATIVGRSGSTSWSSPVVRSPVMTAAASRSGDVIVV